MYDVYHERYYWLSPADQGGGSCSLLTGLIEPHRPCPLPADPERGEPSVVFVTNHRAPPGRPEPIGGRVPAAWWRARGRGVLAL